MKRTLCFLFLFLMLFSMCLPFANAAVTSCVSVSNVSGHQGETITVPVEMTGNPGIVAMRLFIQYDATKLQLLNATDGGLFYNGSQTNDYFGNDITENPYTLLWEDALTKTNYTTNGQLASLSFKILETAAVGKTDIKITLDAGSTFNVDVQNVPFTTQNGSIQINEKPMYSVSFIVDGSTYKTGQYHEGDSITKPTNPTKEGYTFSGWTPSVPATMPAKDMTFTAQFTPNTYDAVLMADGKLVTTIQYTYGQKSIVLPAVPVKEGYTGSWPTYTLPIGGTTITAVYTKNSYTVTWSADGTTTQTTVMYGDPISKPSNPSKEGYTFTGWTPFVPTTMPAENLTFTAQFEVNNYTVTWNIEGKTTSNIVAYGQTINRPADPTKEGYTFKGWTPTIPSTMPAKDLTFTAVFEKTPDPIIKIHNYTSSRTVDYRTTITFSTDQVQNPVDGASIHWFSNGQDKGVTDTYTEKEAKANFTVQAKYMKGSEVLAESEIETVNVKTGFFARLKAFFRALFGSLPKVVQEYLGVEIIDHIIPD